jgi:hypothetical protein
MSAIRRVTRNVKRWQKHMPRRWTALPILHAAKRFRRIRGHRELPILIAALRQQRTALDVAEGGSVAIMTSRRDPHEAQQRPGQPQ